MYFAIAPGILTYPPPPPPAIVNLSWVAQPGLKAAAGGSTPTFNSITYGAGVFVATTTAQVGSFTSPDGVNWTHNTGTGRLLDNRTVRWCGDRFIAGGNYMDVSTSFDGITWVGNAIGNTLIPSTTYLYSVNAIGWNGQTAVCVGDYGVVMYCTNLSTGVWLRSTSMEKYAQVYMCTSNGIAWNGTRFVCEGDSNAILTSPDGINWSAGYFNFGGTIAVSGRPYSNPTGQELVACALSPNISTLVVRTPPAGNFLANLSYNAATKSVPQAGVWINNQWILTGLTGVCVNSHDGNIWAVDTTLATATTAFPGSVVHDMATNGTIVVAVGTDGCCFTTVV